MNCLAVSGHHHFTENTHTHRASHDKHAGVHPNSDGGLWGKHNMIWIANLLVALVTVYFLILEMFL